MSSNGVAGSNGRALFVVARRPEPGKVKTRLAAGIGPSAACRLYAAFLEDISTEFATAPYAFAFAVAPSESNFGFFGNDTFPQVGKSFNDRLLNIFKKKASLFPKGILIMGSDSPQVPAAWIENGFAMLDKSDVVLGPSEDGGYWIIGLKHPHDIFSGITMSTQYVYAQTCAKAQSLNLQVGRLPETFDIDTAEDLDRLRIHLESSPIDQCAATRRVLDTLVRVRR
ncbi:MAG: TIGR04282 family arsenosugar biosynthesis glycosyltransferase [Candidatus Eremiobacteraeota bacterium]|nr:TIGR04282 family arsenosugar biosynthesis glycosyltransferase [Candidatus Eremiobacteraeota bacterium]MBC5827611.1 TIGR04282 family arsenosugar biosynthesis glycosyltransferase [Candidatus Eremiobacteraeota bacterium]